MLEPQGFGPARREERRWLGGTRESTSSAPGGRSRPCKQPPMRQPSRHEGHEGPEEQEAQEAPEFESWFERSSRTWDGRAGSPSREQLGGRHVAERWCSREWQPPAQPERRVQQGRRAQQERLPMPAPRWHGRQRRPARRWQRRAVEGTTSGAEPWSAPESKKRRRST